jgi:hypothetical protein
MMVKALEGITTDIRTLLDTYPPKSAIPMQVISRKLLSILEKYDY